MKHAIHSNKERIGEIRKHSFFPQMRDSMPFYMHACKQFAFMFPLSVLHQLSI